MENVVKILLDVEKKLDDIQLEMDKKKHEFLDLDKEASKNIKNEVIIDVNNSKQKALEDTKNKSEKEAKKILLKSEKNLKELQKIIDNKFQDELEKVIKKVIGDYSVP